MLDGQELLLNEGEWSPWVRLSFAMIPGVSVSGICRLYLKQVHPHFALYVSPIEIDPADPALPISTPESYAAELAERFGPFHTKGLPADTKALAQGLLSEAEFLAQDEQILQEKLAIHDYELARFESGLLFSYISSTDQRAHMFWRLTDPDHPAYDARLARDYAGVIESTYVEMDRMLARTLAKVDRHTTLMVLSDHGFSPYYRSFNLNTWLLEQGYAALKNPAAQGESELLQNVDWSGTRAYALGFNALYVNQRGRESRGSVSISEKRALVEELATRLEAVRDPLTGERVVLTAARTADCYHGPQGGAAPDIIVGYNRGYRASWQTALGKFPRPLFITNDSKWSGDHLMAADALPGVLLANRPLPRASQPTLCDLTATILASFGIPIPPEMEGRALV
jgi:predicted AlkP superfamily phosphohydrolase/phosphomutase